MQRLDGCMLKAMSSNSSTGKEQLQKMNVLSKK